MRKATLTSKLCIFSNNIDNDDDDDDDNNNNNDKNNNNDILDATLQTL